MSGADNGNMLQYLTLSCAERMRMNVLDDLDRYFEKEPEWEDAIPNWKVLSSKNLVKPDLSALSAEDSDVAAALLVHAQMKDLTPQQAADRRVWVFLCLTEGLDYVRNRWFPGPKPGSHTERKEAAKKILAHCFVTNTRSLMRDNGLSRLWWMGYIAYRIDACNPREPLEVILGNQDIRLNLLDRTSFSMNVDILKAIVRRLMKSRAFEKGELFERAIFRDWMRRISRTGGMLLLDALGENGANLIEELAEEALCAAHRAREQDDANAPER